MYPNAWKDSPIVDIEIETIDSKEKVRKFKILLAKPIEHEGYFYCHAKFKGLQFSPTPQFGENSLQALCKGISNIKLELRKYIESHRMILKYNNEVMDLESFEKFFEIK